MPATPLRQDCAWTQGVSTTGRSRLNVTGSTFTAPQCISRVTFLDMAGRFDSHAWLSL